MGLRFLTGSGVVVAAAVLFVSSTAPARTNGPPGGLTRQGRITWNFEALLQDTFGQRSTCARGRWAANFGAGDCSPLAVWSPYAYQFTGARRSAFRVSDRRFSPGYFGNYPTPILIRGRTVACDSSEHRYLVRYTNAANLALDCLKG